MKNRKSVAAALIAAILLTACAGSATQESTGQYIDDSAITTKVKAAFVEDKVVSALDIGVDTYKGSVQLSGYAANQAEIDRAVQIAGHVAGVRAVKNDIRLRPAS